MTNYASLMTDSGLMASLTAIVAAIIAAFLYLRLIEARREINQGRETLLHLQEGFYRSTLDGKQIEANPALVRINGYRSQEEMIEAISNLDTEWYVTPGRRGEFKRLLFEKGRINNFISEVYRHKTRDRIWVSENARLVTDQSTGAPLFYEGTVREITDEIRLNETRNMLEKLADNLPGGLFQISMDEQKVAQFQYMSANFAKLFEISTAGKGDEIRDIRAKIEPEDLAQYDKAFKQSASMLTPLNQQVRFTRSTGDTIWVHVTATPERRGTRDVVWYGHAIDVTRQKEKEQRYERLANFDTLTELPRRDVLEQRLDNTISSCSRRGEFAALVFIDLDNFKHLNDVYGHDAGDELLRQVARRLKAQIRACDLVARYGGDEFVLLIDNLSDDPAVAREKVAQFAEKILNSFLPPFTLGKVEHHASPSLGIALIGSSDHTVAELVNRADSAMYQAKRNGRNTFVVYDNRMADDETSGTDIRKELQGAVARGEFELVYQPQLGRDNSIIGAEALIRWNHPVLGRVPPSEFMVAAEKSGLLGEINDWVMATAIDTLAEWRKQPRLKDLGLSINVPVQQIMTSGFNEKLEKLLSKTSIDRHRLTLEIPESLLSRKPQSVANVMRRIKQTGVRFSLDDFGTGTASLANLNNLPFDEVKIEGLLVSALERDEQSKSMVAGILGIANALKLTTVAEHVGTALEHAYLRERGCDRFQGYHFYPPMQLEEFQQEVGRKAGKSRISMVS